MFNLLTTDAFKYKNFFFCVCIEKVIAKILSQKLIVSFRKINQIKHRH